MIGVMIQAGASILQYASESKRQKKILAQVKESANQEYNYNLGELQDVTADNATINYSNLAKNLFEITSSFGAEKSKVNILQATYGQGTSYNSAFAQAKNQVENELLGQLQTQSHNASVIEQSITENFHREKYKLEMERYNTIAQATSNYQGAQAKLTSGLINTAINLGSDTYDNSQAKSSENSKANSSKGVNNGA